MSVNATPLVSVIMANFNGAAHIAAAVRSVLHQTERALELIVSDDGSSDQSLALAERAAAGDPRLVLVRSGTQTGPAAARNRALAVARGCWIAIVDCDDIIHPERLERLIAAAEADDADIAADDLLIFYDDGARTPHAHLRGALARRPHWISAATYERSNRLLAGGQPLGYLKPVYRREVNGVRPAYDESLRIGEDSDLILRMLIAGARMRIYPEPSYLYRKHAASVSHRLDAASIDAMSAAYGRINAGEDAALARELSRQRSALADARAFTDLILALKRRDLGSAVAAACKRPASLWHLRHPLQARILPSRPRRDVLGRRRVTLLSRQRIVGAVNGSSAYVLAIAGALKRAGYAVDYIGASPLLLGRWAMMRLRPEISVFDRYRVHGGIRIGNLVLARDPRVWITSALYALERGLSKLGLRVGWSRPAQFAQGAAATRADMLFVARNAARAADAVFCDYCFLTPMVPFALSPASPVFTIMHDLISARVSGDGDADAFKLSAAAEFRLLGQSDVIVAIQEAEAALVRAALPGMPVVVAAHPAQPADAPQPGRDDRLLFVGSNTAPNILGLGWFIEQVWPLVRAQRPGARLNVAGSVSRGLRGPAPEGVSFLGVVDDLEPLYRDAGVVISPLKSGSGLKVKLVEALAAGKAVVGTSTTAQGVERLVTKAMIIEDETSAFVRAVTTLLGDDKARASQAQAALACARAHFSPDACLSELLASVRQGLVAPRPAPRQPEEGQPRPSAGARAAGSTVTK